MKPQGPCYTQTNNQNVRLVPPNRFFVFWWWESIPWSDASRKCQSISEQPTRWGPLTVAMAMESQERAGFGEIPPLHISVGKASCGSCQHLDHLT